jgi:hypothetical protein
MFSKNQNLMFGENGLLRRVNKLLRNLFTAPRNDEFILPAPVSFLYPLRLRASARNAGVRFIPPNQNDLESKPPCRAERAG